MFKCLNVKMDFLTKLIFFLKKPKVILVAGNGYRTAAEAIFQILSQKFDKVQKLKRISGPEVFKGKIFILESNYYKENKKEFNFLIKGSSLFVLVVTHVGEPQFERTFFAGEIDRISAILEMVNNLPAFSYLVLNYDDETVREIKEKSSAHSLTFGLGAEADFRATDVILTDFPARGTNFKLNYKGNIIPIWLKNLFGKEQIYAALTGVAVGTIFGLNLVEISQALKGFKGISGKMRLIKGIRGSWILDDSESATVFSMIEAVEILKNLTAPRKIAVLGDIFGIGKYAIEAHETIGERVGKAVDLLFAVGPRAKFIAKAAFSRGMSEEKIFHFEKIEEVVQRLRDEIKKEDLILVDGSKEMKMEKIIEEIKEG